jgi:hypothetical protein
LIEVNKRLGDCGFYYPASNSIYNMGGGENAPGNFNDPAALNVHELKATPADSVDCGGAGQQAFRSSINTKINYMATSGC